MSKDDTPTQIITITAYHETVLQATKAEFFVTVKGNSFFKNDAAMAKARELSQFAAELKEVGLTDEHIQLQGVRAEVAKGVFGQMSVAYYDLIIHCPNIAMVGDILAVITAQKDISLGSLLWRYDDSEESENVRLEKTILKARIKAEITAKVLGFDLLGVVRFVEKDSYAMPSQDKKTYGGNEYSQDMRASMRISASRDDFDKIPTRHAKTVINEVIIEYHVSALIS